MTPSFPYPSFSELRRNLDPRCSYIVLECAEASGAENKLNAAFAALPVPDGDIAEKRLCRDNDRQRLFLVVRLIRERAEINRERILSATLSTDFTLSFYRKSEDGGAHGVEIL